MTFAPQKGAPPVLQIRNAEELGYERGLADARAEVDHTHPAATGSVRELPEVAPGHWTTPAGRDMALATLDDPHMARSRERISDFALANEVFLSPGIANLTDAKERIRWLSAQLLLAAAPTPDAAASEVAVPARPVTRMEVIREWVGGERYARDYEYCDANFKDQADRVLALFAAPKAASEAGEVDEQEITAAAKRMVAVQGMDWAELDTHDIGYWESLAVATLTTQGGAEG